jgi:death-on-curing protein
VSEPVFLDVEDVLLIHEEQLPRYGGSSGIRDRGLLESAVAMPRASAGGAFAHQDLFAMAAAYAFHIAQNQPFGDGNKRTTRPPAARAGSRRPTFSEWYPRNADHPRNVRT